MQFKSIFKRMIFLIATVMMVPLLVLFTQVSAQEEAPTRVYTAPDMGSFTYSLDTYSVRNSLTDLPEDQEMRVVFPGVVTIDPNDSLIYSDEPGNVYRIRIASVVTETAYTEADLPDLLGTLPLVQYEPAIVSDKQIIELEVGGMPAIRVNDVPVGQFGLEAHIIVLNEAQVFEIIVEPVVLTDQADKEVQIERKKMYEDIIASIEWVAP
jgi:hypothetical protein